MAAAPALVDVAVETVDRGDFDRSTLLLGRLMEEAAADPSAVFGAALGGKRLEAFFAPRLIAEAMHRALGAGGADAGRLTLEDAYSVACWGAHEHPAIVRGYTAAAAATGRTMTEFLDTVSASSPSAGHVLGLVSQCGLGCLGAVDEPRCDCIEEAYAVRRRATAAAYLAGSAASIARAARSGDQRRVEEGRALPHRPTGACARGNRAWYV